MRKTSSSQVRQASCRALPSKYLCVCILVICCKIGYFCARERKLSKISRILQAQMDIWYVAAARWANGCMCACRMRQAIEISSPIWSGVQLHAVSMRLFVCACIVSARPYRLHPQYDQVCSCTSLHAVCMRVHCMLFFIACCLYATALYHCILHLYSTVLYHAFVCRLFHLNIVLLKSCTLFRRLPISFIALVNTFWQRSFASWLRFACCSCY